MPYLGTREFFADFGLCEEVPPCPEELQGSKDLGWMLLDMDYRNPERITPRFFRAELKDGILEVPPFDGEEVVG